MKSRCEHVDFEQILDGDFDEFRGFGPDGERGGPRDWRRRPSQCCKEQPAGEFLLAQPDCDEQDAFHAPCGDTKQTAGQYHAGKQQSGARQSIGLETRFRYQFGCNQSWQQVAGLSAWH
jgi:hypothetical protein